MSNNSLTLSNATSDWREPQEENSMYKVGLSVMTTLVMALLVFSMGCTVEVKKLWDNIKRPWGIAVGMICQYGLMPLVAYILAISLATTTTQSVAILILGCCPGGTVSNLFTYWIDGDMDLSISMTTCSTIAALGMMPFCLYIYTYSWELADGITVPYQTIGTSLLSLIIPVACGVFTNNRWPKHSKIIAKVGGILGITLLMVESVIDTVLSKDSLTLELSILTTTAVFSFTGYIGGFLLALITCQSWPRARTIALETGSQNIALYFALLQLSLNSHHFSQIITLPMLYGAFQLLNGLLITAVYHIYKKCLGKREEEKALAPHVNMLDIPGSKIAMGFEKEEDGPVHSKMENEKVGQFQQVAEHDMTSLEGIP
ncbi:LOW QUALITY PROTEIN: sodium-dependent organic anion transporter [Heteronotia binoei]|uniref:LOW QUALITY PROTEIN: sodium-dependent organic anion transporter n=1 Tax=Heteronotia binoei TaxID=13085 RepID=UPI00292FBB7D|nr:LOW QUALITY PROTEIN: sodium-dependent organic anion transporter [Heteronotia binoei]